MDLTPQLFRDVQFTERRGAYDKDEVHAFLARVGTAVGQMQERVREAQRRIEASDEHVAKLEAAAREQRDADETLRRTLVLAQRTADAAVQEAHDEAEVIVAEARKKADDLVVQAEEAVRRDVGATRDRLEAEIRDLETHRQQIKQRIEAISTHLEAERLRIHDEIDALKSVLDDPSRVALASVPGDDPAPLIVLTGHRPDAVVNVVDEPSDELPDAEQDDRIVEDRAGDLGAEIDSGVDSAASAGEANADRSDDLSHLPPPPADWDASRPHVVDPVESDAATLFGASDDLHDGGPPTEAHPIVAGTSFGGSHLDELRRAVSDDDGDPEADAALAAFFDQDTDEEPSRRFGRRR